MTGITPEGFEIDRDFAAPPSAVFAAWTTAEHFSRWFGGKDVQVPADRLDYEPATGRAWSATMVLPDGNTIDWPGAFLEVVPDRGLVLPMTDQPGEPSRFSMPGMRHSYRTCRCELTGPAIMNHPRCRVTTVARAWPRGGRSTRGPA